MSTLFRKLEVFYKMEFLRVKDTWRCSLTISYLLLLIQQGQLASIVMNSFDDYSNDPFLGHILSPALNYLKIYPLVDDSINGQLLLVFFVFGLDVIFYICLLHQILGMEKPQQINGTLVQPLINDDDHNLSSSQASSINYGFSNCIRLMTSIYIQIYREVFITPLMYCHLNIFNYAAQNTLEIEYQIGTVISGIQIVTSYGLCLIIEANRFEYRFRRLQFLGNNQNTPVTIMKILEKLLLILSVYQPDLSLYLGMAFAAVFLIVSINQMIFVDIHMQVYACYLSLTLVLLYGSILLTRTVNNQSLLYAASTELLMLTTPISIIIMNRVQVLLSNQGYHCQSIQQLRIIYSYLQESKRLQLKQRQISADKTVKLYSYVANHISNCERRRELVKQQGVINKYQCFCDYYFNDHPGIVFKNSFQMYDLGIGITAQQLENWTKIDNKNENIKFTYIYYLIYVSKLPTQALYELLKLSNDMYIMTDSPSKQLSQKQNAIIMHMKQCAIVAFNKIAIKNKLTNQNYNFKQIQDFEENIKIVKNNMDRIGSQRLYWFEMLINNPVDTILFQELGTRILEAISTIDKQLHVLLIQNPASSECDTLMNIFSTHLQYNKRKYRQSRNPTAYENLINNTDSKLFSSETSLIQITLMQPRGNIIKFTKQFQNTIGYTETEIINQNINKFMPQVIAVVHDDYLNNFVERGKISIVKASKRIVLAKHKSEFIIPLNTRIRLETNIHQLAATALLTPVHNSFGYMILSDSGKIEEISQNIFIDIFQSSIQIDLQVLKGLLCQIFIPELQQKWGEIISDTSKFIMEIFKCHIIFPKWKINQVASSNNISCQRTREKYYRHLANDSDMMSNHLKFSVDLQITKIATQYQKLIQLEVQNYQIIQGRKYDDSLIIQIQALADSVIGNSLQKQSVIYSLTQRSYSNRLITTAPRDQLIFDLEEDLNLEEEQMIVDQKNQFSTVNLTVNLQVQQTLQPINSVRNEHELLQVSMKQSQIQQDIPVQRKTAKTVNAAVSAPSVSSMSSQRKNNGLSKELSESINETSGISKISFSIISIVCLIILAFNIGTFVIEVQEFNEIQHFEQLLVIPFKQSYFYNEAMISSYYLNNLEFEFPKLMRISAKYLLNTSKSIDEITKRLPYLDTQLLPFNITYKSHVIQLIGQTTDIIEQIGIINFQEQTVFSTIFDEILKVIKANDQNLQSINLLIPAYMQIIIVLALMTWYCYKFYQLEIYLARAYQLFTVLDSQDMLQLLSQFQAMTHYLRSNKFKMAEVDEERFEQSMCRTHNQTTSHLSKQLKLGRVIRKYDCTKRRTLFILLLIVSIITHGGFIFALNRVQQNVIQETQTMNLDKDLFLEVYRGLSLSYSLMSTIMFNFDNIDKDVGKVQLNDTVAMMNSLRNQLALFQAKENEATYTIVTSSACDIFNQSYTQQSDSEDYYSLFSETQCFNIQLLNMGVSVVVQTLYLYLQQFQEAYTLQNYTKDELIADFYQTSPQINRLYVSMSLFHIVDTITEYESSELSYATTVCAIILVCFNTAILITTYLLIRVMNMRKREYQQSKQLLGLIPMHYLIENAYVISFVLKEIRVRRSLCDL